MLDWRMGFLYLFARFQPYFSEAVVPIPDAGARSSGVEHLPFKQRVGGSSPPALTGCSGIHYVYVIKCE